MMTGRMRSWVLGLGMVCFGGVVGQAPVAGQERERATECRCVDRDGSEVERCLCFRMPDVERIVAQAMPLGGPRPRLGISLELSDGAGQGVGARIAGVLEDGPAARAGLREGDVVIRVDGHRLTEPLGPEVERRLRVDEALPPQRLLALIRDVDPGQDVEIEYLRDGAQGRVTVEAQDLTGWTRTFAVRGPLWNAEDLDAHMRDLREDMRARMPQGWPVDGGLHLVRVGPELGSYFGTDRGVLVAEAPEESALGLQVGDVVLAIDGRATGSPGRLRSILRSYQDGETVTFTVRRDGQDVEVSGTVQRRGR